MPLRELPLLRFIPFRRVDILHMCRQDGRLDEARQQQLELAGDAIDTHFAREFHGIKARLKEAYGPLDPDADTRLVRECREPRASAELASILGAVLDRANYERVSDEALQRAFATASLFHVQLYVDMNDFEEAFLYVRGASHREEELRKLFGLWRKRVEFLNFDRVVLFIRFKEDVDAESTLGGCQPGSTMLKLFQNVPAADVEMLFPNTRVGMRTLDKLLIGVPALVSGGVVMTTKMGATLVLLGSLVGFWVGLSSEPVSLDRPAVLASAWLWRRAWALWADTCGSSFPNFAIAS